MPDAEPVDDDRGDVPDDVAARELVIDYFDVFQERPDNVLEGAEWRWPEASPTTAICGIALRAPPVLEAGDRAWLDETFDEWVVAGDGPETVLFVDVRS